MRTILARHLCKTALGVMCFLSGLAQAQVPVNVTTYHNDNSRTGQNTLETILTPSNVNFNQFGKLFSVAVDADVYAQPLYLSGISIAGGTHNVVYVATENDTVYAIDADSGTIYQHVNLIAPGGSILSSGKSGLNCGDLVPQIGITGTPVIATNTDPNNDIIYLVANSIVNGTTVQYLHALNVVTLAEALGNPVLIQASVAGTAKDGNGSTVSFNAFQQNQRAALLLENGHVVIGWSSHCDDNPWHGWVMSYSASNLAQEAVFNTSPNGNASGVWMSGGGIAADASGNIYFPTGNGDWDGTSDYGDSIVKLGPPSGGKFPVLDYFTPWDQGTLDANDSDVASGGLVLLPALPSGQQLLAQEGKMGTIVLLDVNNLGKYCVNLKPACTGSDTQIHEIVGASDGIWGSPAYWNGNIYWSGEFDPINAYSFNANNSGLIAATPTSQSAQSFAYLSPTPSISANGSSAGILWALDGSADDSTCDGGSANCLGLFAYDATNLKNMLYNSMQAGSRDSLGVAVKFAPPVIANGKVYVGTQTALTVFGLLPASATPISVNLSGADNVNGIVSNGSAVPNGGLDGSGFAYSATLLGSSITAFGSTFTLGAAGTANAVDSKTITLPAGNYNSVNLLATGVHGNQTAQTFLVTYSDGTTSTFTQSLSDWFFPSGYSGESVAVTMAYRLNPSGTTGSGPCYLYSYSFALNSAKTVASITLPNNRNVVVLAIDLTPVATGTGTPTAASPTFSPPSGSYTSAQMVSLLDSTPGSTIYYALNGATLSTSSPTYNNTPLSISATTSIQAFAVASGYNNSPVSSATYTIGPQGTTPVSVNLSGADNVNGIVSNGSAVPNGGLDGSGFAYSATLLGSSITAFGSTFTLGAAGTANAVDSKTITLPAGNYNSVNLLATGVHGNQTGQTFLVTYSDGTTSTFTQSLSDWFFPSGYSGESVAVTMAYRLNPSGTTGSGPCYLYSYSFALNSAKTVASITLPNNRNVVVLAIDLTPVATGTGTPTAASPTFSPPSGSYTSAQMVSLLDSTPGSTIYYALNGATLSTSSPTYNNTPLSISATTSIQAFAVASGYNNSPVSSATYTIGPQGTTPVSVNLSGADNVNGIVSNGSAVPNGGLDGSGFAYSATLLGSSITALGSTFTLGAAGTANAVDSKTITLPAGNYNSVNLLATGVHGNQTGQTFLVTYSDGTTSTFTQSLSDWFFPSGYSGESVAVTMAYRLNPSGTTGSGPCYLYSYSFALNSAKTVASITLPNNRNVVVLAVNLMP